MVDLRWDDTSGRFRDGSGRYISERSVRAVVDQVADQASARLAASAQAMLDGTKSLATFQAEAMATIKQAHVATAVIAHGGAEQMTFSRYGSVGNEIKSQYQYMRGMAEDIASGRQPLNRTIVSRAAMYGQASRITYEKTRNAGQRQRGYAWERNVIHSGETCSGCRAQSARGLVPIGSLVPVGSRTCLSRCRCTLSYARTNEAAQAA